MRLPGSLRFNRVFRVIPYGLLHAYNCQVPALRANHQLWENPELFGIEEKFTR
jgi:hypothetical protein